MNDVIEDILAGLPGASVAVIGDLAVDRYWVVDFAQRYPSRETGLPIQQVVATWASPGGAGTVINQLHALGAGKVGVAGLVGDDADGLFLCDAFRRLGVDSSWVKVVPNRPTPAYHRVLAVPNLRECTRYDVYPRSRPSAQEEQDLIAALKDIIETYSVLVVSDYTEPGRPGIFSPKVCDAISKIAKDKPQVPVIVDSRMQGGLFHNVFFKMNAREFMAMTGLESEERDNLAATGQEVARREGRPVIITLGSSGALVCKPDKIVEIPGFTIDGETDIVGAGDAVLAGVSAALAVRAPVETACLLGVLVASLAVQQLRTTGRVSPEQVCERWQQWQKRHGWPRW